ncbi:hypothetical protein AJ79_03081 [Helicocarpus griseus UAMH5409]|uniref:C2H2-type domain-containing protein n=1 Tax=Helicocarpus griseus UAMH5409 TaxID=1447875 RepID=A0A2B7Y0W1_9EURO|nr:hypothetical protein AJ79_03081 [Helicocarpus griseus UAMH5409]
METAVPVTYNVTNHDMNAVAHRRMMAPHHHEQNMAYFSNPAAISYSTPLQPPSFGGFSNLLNGHPHHTPYQGYFHSHPNPHVNSQPQPQSQPQHHHPHPPQHPQHPHPHQPHQPRLATDTAPVQQLSDIRHVKTPNPRLIRPSPPKEDPVPPPAPQRVNVVPSRNVEQIESQKPTPKPEVEFGTEVDTLMKTIQAKPQTLSSPQAEHQLPPLQQKYGNGWIHPATYANQINGNQGMFPNAPQDRVPSTNQKPRKYECTLPQCRKSFFQKTHLDIHMRAHTGDKPFICKEPSCGQKFSQLGNLKTHERRHTGEKPYSCDICHKRFAQRGNVRAHKITHEQAKPYTCRLDDCGKQFTQLGNLKSHQNKFHAQTLRNLTLRFSTITDTDRMSPQDKELWDYFSTLYRNSNKGIKGRGKDRRVSTAKRSTSTYDRSASDSEDESKGGRSRSYDRASVIMTSSSDEPGYREQIYHNRGGVGHQ